MQLDFWNHILPTEPERRKALLADGVYLIAAIIIAAMVTLFGFQSYRVDGESMQNTLHNNDRLIIDKVPRTLARITGHDYIPHRGDIIVFSEPGLLEGRNRSLIKRVVGLPGDQVQIKDGQVVIFDSSNPNGFNPDTSGLYHLDTTATAGSVDITLGPDQLFVMGDNRGNSTDSRVFGPIDANQVIGKLVARMLPANQAQRF